MPTVVRLNSPEPLKETKLAKVIGDEGPSIKGRIIYPLRLLGQTVYWLKAFISEVAEKDYKPLARR